MSGRPQPTLVWSAPQAGSTYDRVAIDSDGKRWKRYRRNGQWTPIDRDVVSKTLARCSVLAKKVRDASESGDGTALSESLGNLYEELLESDP